jgi:hypothetical protein
MLYSPGDGPESAVPTLVGQPAYKYKSLGSQMKAEQEMIQESGPKAMMANNVMLETLSPNPELKFKEIKLDGCGNSNTVRKDSEQYKQGCTFIYHTNTHMHVML